VTDVYTQLRAAILRGQYAPHQRLIENDLTQHYGTSRFLLRIALTRLEAEGLIEIQPHRGARIREITVPEAIEITEIRRSVESLVAARAAERATDYEIAGLRELGASMRAAVEAGDTLRYSELNAQLHATVRTVARHDSAIRIIEQLHGQMVRHQFRLALVPGRPNVSLAEHLAIIDAICARDPAAAEHAMHTHLTSVLTTLNSFAPAAP
jgi:DNA-binding GntR family transcriptional regulator